MSIESNSGFPLIERDFLRSILAIKRLGFRDQVTVGQTKAMLQVIYIVPGIQVDNLPNRFLAAQAPEMMSIRELQILVAEHLRAKLLVEDLVDR